MAVLLSWHHFGMKNKGRGGLTLGEVASGAREAGVVVVVLLLLVVPGGNGGLEVLVASCKVLTELITQKKNEKNACQ